MDTPQDSKPDQVFGLRRPGQKTESAEPYGTRFRISRLHAEPEHLADRALIACLDLPPHDTRSYYFSDLARRWASASWGLPIGGLKNPKSSDGRIDNGIRASRSENPYFSKYSILSMLYDAKIFSVEEEVNGQWRPMKWMPLHESLESMDQALNNARAATKTPVKTRGRKPLPSLFSDLDSHRQTVALRYEKRREEFPKESKKSASRYAGKNPVTGAPYDSRQIEAWLHLPGRQ